jgi:hypothetical protein
MDPFVIGDEVWYRENPPMSGLAQHVGTNPSQTTMRRKKKVMSAIRSTNQRRACINVPYESWGTRLYVGTLKRPDHLSNRPRRDSHVCIEVKAREAIAFRISEP